MSRENVLARVEADIARSDYERAKNRLRTVLRDAPADLDIRERLAAVYRRAGNPVEAGRWSFLGDQVDHEQAAFVRAYPDPWLRLRVLGWAGAIEDAPAPAAERLRSLAAAVDGPAKVHWHEDAAPTNYPRERTSALDVLAIAIGLAAFVLAGLGLVTVVRWVVF